MQKQFHSIDPAIHLRDFNLQTLPKLPVPDVSKTLSRYLDSVKAFVSTEDFERTERHVRNYVENKDMVEAIERKLRERSEKEENWVKIYF